MLVHPKPFRLNEAGPGLSQNVDANVPRNPPDATESLFMKKPFPICTALVAAAAFLTLAPTTALHAQGKPGWVDNQPKALEKAKAEKKMVLMDFTGSDWCGWCMKMDKEVFNTPEFKDFAKDNLVLVELDFPHQKYINPQTKKQNADLQNQYKVQGFPTLVVLDADGKELKTFGGYQEGGAKAFIEQLKKLKS